MKLIQHHQNSGCDIYLNEDGKYSVSCAEFGERLFNTLSEAISYCNVLYSSYN